jgi:hypothetical protein
MFDTLNVTAGALNPHQPKRTVSAARLVEWLQEADTADAASLGS